MIVYFIVILWVVVFAGIAEQLDIKFIPDEANTTRPLSNHLVYHTSNTCFVFIISSLVLVLVAGLRYRVGTDYGGYYLGWYKYAETFWEDSFLLNEPGYKLICVIFKYMGINDGAYPIFVASVLTVGLALLTIYRNSTKLLLASILFIFLYWISGFNAVRQCLATTFVFCGYGALCNKKIKKYMFWVGIAFLCHRSAICMFFPYFFIHNEISYKNMFFLILGCIVFLQSYNVAFEFTGAILDKEFNIEELGGYNFNEVNRLRILFNCLPAAFFFMMAMIKKSTISYLHTFWINILLFKAAISLAAMNSPYLSRMGIYFSPFLILSYCGLIDELPKQYKKLFSLGLCLYCGVFFLFETYNSSTLRYFHFIWER